MSTGDNPFGQLMEQQVAGAVALALGLPWGLLVLSAKPDWLGVAAAATATRRLACTLWGAGLIVLTVCAVALCWNVRELRFAAVALLAAGAANLFTGFAVQSLVQGRALLRRDACASAMVWGWTARAGVVLVPIVGVIAGAYFVASAFGAPFVARLSSRGNATTDPSAGSTPAN
jgi:hypothetical protein